VCDFAADVLLILGGKFVVAIVTGIAGLSFSASFVVGITLNGEVNLDVSTSSEALG
jgi:hypothetical protein